MPNDDTTWILDGSSVRDTWAIDWPSGDQFGQHPTAVASNGHVIFVAISSTCTWFPYPPSNGNVVATNATQLPSGDTFGMKA